MGPREMIEAMSEAESLRDRAGREATSEDHARSLRKMADELCPPPALSSPPWTVDRIPHHGQVRVTDEDGRVLLTIPINRENYAPENTLRELVKQFNEAHTRKAETPVVRRIGDRG